MISIITGDIVNSRKASDFTWLAALKKTLIKFGKQPNDWDIFRGDSFQLKVAIEEAFFAAFLIKSYLKQIDNIDVRIGVGIGKEINNSKNITEANGEAFINSGKVFEGLVKKQLIAIKSPWIELDDEFNLALELALLTMNNWTKNSAEVFQISIENPTLTQNEIADKLEITQGRVSERQKRAGYDAISKLEKRYRKQIKEKTSLL